MKTILKLAESMSSDCLENLIVKLREIISTRRLAQNKLRAKWLVARKDIHPVCKS
jgi:hypothetical protein